MVRNVKCLVNLLKETNASPRDATTACLRGGGSLREEVLGDTQKHRFVVLVVRIFDAFVFFFEAGYIIDPFSVLFSFKKANLRVYSEWFSCVAFVFFASAFKEKWCLRVDQDQSSNCYAKIDLLLVKGIWQKLLVGCKKPRSSVFFEAGYF